MNNVIDIIKKNDNFVVLTHTNPDGDAIGSSLGMYHILKKLNKNVDVIINDVPKKFSYLNGYNDIKNSTNKNYDYAIIVDTATKERINTEDVLNNVNNIVNIDHHISNKKYGDINYIEDYPACAEIIYNIFKELNIELDKNIGEALANGIITDTGGLSHADVTNFTYKTIYELSNYINMPKIYKNTLYTVTKAEFELKKIAINNLSFYKDNKIAYSFVIKDDIIKSGGTEYDAGALVNLAREIEGVYVSIFTKFLDNKVRISLRSNNIDVNKIATLFNGGGHILASGIEINNVNEYETIFKEVIKELGNSIDEWDNCSK